MIANLDTQLARFKEKIKRTPEKVRITQREDYTGGGATGLMQLVLLLLVPCLRQIRGISGQERLSHCKM